MIERRQKILLGAFATLVLATVGDRVLSSYYFEPVERAERTAAGLTTEVEETRQKVRRAKKDAQRLTQLRNISLPADVEGARTYYQAWLTDLAENIEFAGLRVDSSPPRTFDGYQGLPFSLRCTGNLEKLTALLYEFYRTPMLHHIKSLTITPIASSRELNLSLAIEALLIDGAPAEFDPPDDFKSLLANDGIENYQAVARRNFFSTSGGVEAAAYTALTAIVAVNDAPQAWFTNLLEGQVEKVAVGDRFRVGALDCQVEEITVRDVVLAVDGQRWLLTIDERVADALALPPEY